MVKLTKIYTRGGDEGFTSLGSGDRVAKYYAEYPGSVYIGWVDKKDLPYRCAFGDYDGGAYCVERDDE